MSDRCEAIESRQGNGLRDDQLQPFDLIRRQQDDVDLLTVVPSRPWAETISRPAQVESIQSRSGRLLALQCAHALTLAWLHATWHPSLMRPHQRPSALDGSISLRT
ncbi:MAG: hypothetical protein EBV72_10685 [Betaproteobacteria bacterium]|nr:hypothetical protein [Betaproteobacteria bacterium]